MNVRRAVKERSEEGQLGGGGLQNKFAGSHVELVGVADGAPGAERVISDAPKCCWRTRSKVSGPVRTRFQPIDDFCGEVEDEEKSRRLRRASCRHARAWRWKSRGRRGISEGGVERAEEALVK